MVTSSWRYENPKADCKNRKFIHVIELEPFKSAWGMIRGFVRLKQWSIHSPKSFQSCQKQCLFNAYEYPKAKPEISWINFFCNGTFVQFTLITAKLSDYNIPHLSFCFSRIFVSDFILNFYLLLHFRF